MQRVREKIETESKKHPELRDVMIELYFLAIDEIDDGESLENEVELAIGSIDELIEENRP